MKEIKIEIPQGYEVEKTETEDGTFTIKLKELKLPHSWEEFCVMYPKIKSGECFIGANSEIIEGSFGRYRNDCDKNLLPNRATTEAVLALCQLIQLRECYNQGWVPEWGSGAENKYCIDFAFGNICTCTNCVSPLLLYFKSEELRDEFLRNFRPLIDKLKQLYGIKGGGEK